MADETAEKRREELLRTMREQRGYMLGPWEFMAEKDPDFIAAYNDLYTQRLVGWKSFAYQNEGVGRNSHSRISRTHRWRLRAHEESPPARCDQAGIDRGH